MQLKWTDLASKDLDEIEIYIAKDNSVSVAIDVVLKIIDRTEMILMEYPHSGRPGRAKDTRELVIDNLPYLIVYRIQHINEIQVLRVLHTAQQWPIAPEL